MNTYNVQSAVQHSLVESEILVLLYALLYFCSFQLCGSLFA